MIVALIALVFAMTGTAVAAAQLVSGDKLIKKNSLSGDRLRKGTVTGTQIKVATLGTVPSAAQAGTATNANHATSADTATSATSATHAGSADSATNATHASSADTLRGIGPSIFGSSIRIMGRDFTPQSSGETYSPSAGGGVSAASGQYFVHKRRLHGRGGGLHAAVTGNAGRRSSADAESGSVPCL
jgi:hypothetical protein